MNCDVAPLARADTVSQEAELTPGMTSRAPAKIVAEAEIPFAVVIACTVTPYVAAMSDSVWPRLIVWTSPLFAA